MNKVNGFTLMELMIVVAVIGVLSWVSVPKYQTFLLKTTATSQMAAAIRPLQLAVSEYAALNGMLPSNFSELANIGFLDHNGDEYDDASDFSTGAVSGVDVNFPDNSSSEFFLSVAFACQSLSSFSCTKVAPKELQTLTLEVTGKLLENGALHFFIDPTRAENKKFKGFLPRL